MAWLLARRSSGGLSEVLRTGAVTNWNNATSPGFQSWIQQFEPGQIPAGRIPVLCQSGVALGGTEGAQYTRRNYWKDGSLKTACVAAVLDSFSSLQSRPLEFRSIVGSYNNSSAITAADIISNLNLKVLFTSLTQYNGSTTVARGSGAFTATCNTALGTATRITRIDSGPLMDTFEVWFLATDNTGGASDAHLKVRFYVTIWKTTAGAIADFQHAAVVTQDWYSAANLPTGGDAKYRLNYTAEYVNGASSLETYSGLQHAYNTQWATYRKNNDNNNGARVWHTAIPTLMFVPTMSEWIQQVGHKHRPFPAVDLSTSVLDLALHDNIDWTPAGAYENPGYSGSYTPLWSANHRADIDSPSLYIARGFGIANYEAVTMISQTAPNRRRTRVNNIAMLLSQPLHFRSNHLRTRPSESADIADTILPLRVGSWTGGTPSFPSFTADGMPASAHYSAAAGTNSYVAAQGGTGAAFDLSSGTTHALQGGLLTYMTEADPIIMRGIQSVAAGYTQTPLSGNEKPLPYSDFANFVTAMSIPSQTWGGIAGVDTTLSSRGIGFMALRAGQADYVTPGDAVESNYKKAWCKQLGDILAYLVPSIPADMAAGGIWGDGPFSNFFGNFNLGAVANCYCLTEEDVWLTMAQHMGKSVVNIATISQAVQLAYGTCILAKPVTTPPVDYFCMSAWHPSTNPVLAAADWQAHNNATSYTASTGLFTRTDATPQLQGLSFNMPFTDGDKVWMQIYHTGDYNTTLTPPAPFSYPGQYFARDVNNATKTFKLAATLGGAAITGGADTSLVIVSVAPQYDPSVADGAIFPISAKSDYQTLRSATAYADILGLTGAQTAHARMLAFCAPMTTLENQWPQYSMNARQ